MYAPLENLDPNQTWTMEDLNRLKVIQLIPSIIHFSLVSLFGVIGNICVIIIFTFRFSPSIHRYFILVLASFDLVASAIGGPFTVVESFFPFEFQDEVCCKIARLMFYITCIASSLTLVLISIERHRKICLPLKKQFNLGIAKWAVFIVPGVFSVISSIPAGIYYGASSVDTGLPSVVGTKCFVKDIYDKGDNTLPVLHNVYLLLLAIIATAIMSFCYIQISRQVAKVGKDNVENRNKCNDIEVDAKDENNINDITDSPECLENGKSKEMGELGVSKENIASKSSAISSSEGNLDSNTEGKDYGFKKHGAKTKTVNITKSFIQPSKYSGKTVRITKIMMMVTIAFCMSYIPHLTLMLLHMCAPKDALPTDNLYRIMFYACLFNNMLNPFIYAAMDLKYRAELKKLLTCQFPFKKRI